MPRVNAPKRQMGTLRGRFRDRQKFPPFITLCVTEIHKGSGHLGPTPCLYWLPFLDTYRTMCLAPEPALKRLLEDVRDLRLAA